MIFSELYGVYYNAVARILSDAVNGRLEEKSLQSAVLEHAFGESVLSIAPSLKNEKWQLLKKDLTTPLRAAPDMPLTLLQKRWLKAVLDDPRLSLFGVKLDFLDDVEPLFTREDYCVFDKYSDGDTYDDKAYRENFELILNAIKEKYPLKIEFINRAGRVSHLHVKPVRLEYSEKDDKFRLISENCRYGSVINLSRIIRCKRYYGDKFPQEQLEEERTKKLTLEIVDEKSSLERVLMHFAHFEKRAERIGNDTYTVTVSYDERDESEMVIRVLSFGSKVKVVSPAEFTQQMKTRLKKQLVFLK